MARPDDRSKRRLSRRRLLATGAAAGAATLFGMPLVSRYGRAAGPMAGKKLGYSMSFATIEWLVAQRRGVEEMAKKYGFELTVSDANDSPAKQVRDIEDLVIRGMDVILISTYYNEAITPAVRMINEAGIPLVVLSSSIKGDVSWTAHLSADTMGTSHEAGTFYVDTLGGAGKVVQIEGKPGSSVNQMRGAGWREVLQKHPEIEIVGHAVANYERAQALRHMEDILQAQREIDAVYCHNDDMALGAIQAAKEAGRNTEMWFTGYDGIQPEVMAAIHKGEMKGTWQYLPMGAEGVDVAAHILQGEEIPKQIVFPSPFITKENVIEFWDPETNKMRPFKSQLKL